MSPFAPAHCPLFLRSFPCNCLMVGCAATKADRGHLSSENPRFNGMLYLKPRHWYAYSLENKAPTALVLCRSPEICEDKPYDMKSDVWSLGCILYELTALRRPFEGESLPALMVNILRGSFPPPPGVVAQTFAASSPACCLKSLTNAPAWRRF